MARRKIIVKGFFNFKFPRPGLCYCCFKGRSYLAFVFPCPCGNNATSWSNIAGKQTHTSVLHSGGAPRLPQVRPAGLSSSRMIFMIIIRKHKIIFFLARSRDIRLVYFQYILMDEFIDIPHIVACQL